MPKTPEQHLQNCFSSVKRWLGAAEDWNTKNHAGWESFSLYLAIRAYLTIAVKQYATPNDGLIFITNPETQSVVDRATNLTLQIYLEADAPPPGTPPSSIDDLLALVHVLWLMGRFEDAFNIARICDDDNKLKFFQLDRFWREYSRAVASASQRTPFLPEQLKVNGYKKHWLPYMFLLSDITHRRDLSSSLAAIDESYIQRQTDKRLINGEFDGDGTFPVRWDFRRQSCMALARQIYGLCDSV